MDIKTIESCINIIAKEFRHNTLNFIKEEDLRSRLYSIMVTKKPFKKRIKTAEGEKNTFAVHANWFGLKSVNKGETRGYCDLVILKESSLEKLHNLAGEITSIFANELPCYAGIEIKRWPGELHNLPRVNDSSDLADLKSMLQQNKVKWGYGLVFIDEDINSNNDKDYTEIINWYKQQIQDTKHLHIWLIPRTGKIYRL